MWMAVTSTAMTVSIRRRFDLLDGVWRHSYRGQPLPQLIHRTSIFTMDVNDKIHAQLVKAGVKLAASLPDDWVNTLIRRVERRNEIRHVRVGREAETIAICAGAFFGGVRAVAIFGNTGLLTCTGEMATLCLRHMIPVFCIVSGRGSIDDHKVYQEVQGRRTIPLLQAYDYPYKVIDKEEEIEDIPDAYEWHRLQKRPFVLFLTKKLLGTNA